MKPAKIVGFHNFSQHVVIPCHLRELIFPPESNDTSQIASIFTNLSVGEKPTYSLLNANGVRIVISQVASSRSDADFSLASEVPKEPA